MCKHIKFYASLRAESKLITLQSEFVIFFFLQPEQNVRMILKWHMACDWQLELNCTNQELHLWAKGVLQNKNDFKQA